MQDLSAKVGLTSWPCWSRIKRMEGAGVIEGLVDTVIVQVTLDSQSDEALFEFGRELEAIPEIKEAFLVSGDYNYYVRIAVERHMPL